VKPEKGGGRKEGKEGRKENQKRTCATPSIHITGSEPQYKKVSRNL
jgi:hypothetical protein